MLCSRLSFKIKEKISPLTGRIHHPEFFFFTRIQVVEVRGSREQQVLLLFSPLKGLITLFPLSMFEESLDRMTPSPAGYSHTCTLPHSPRTLFSPSLSLNPHPPTLKNVAGPVPETHAWLEDDGVHRSTNTESSCLINVL